MKDEKNKKGKVDDTRMDIQKVNEINYLRQRFPNIGRAEIIAAINLKGPLKKDIISYLQHDEPF